MFVNRVVARHNKLHDLLAGEGQGEGKIASVISRRMLAVLKNMVGRDSRAVSL